MQPASPWIFSEDLAHFGTIRSYMWYGQIGLQILLFAMIRAIVRRLLSQLGGEPATVIEIVRRIAKGDLSSAVATRSGDETSLLAATKSMQEGLEEDHPTVETKDKAEIRNLIDWVLSL